MSRLQTERLSIGLCPQQLAVIRHGRRWPRVADAVFSLPVLPVSDAPSWQPALTALGAWLNETPLARARCEVVLASRWLRYAVIPWVERITADEEQALLQACFETRYGDMSGWTLRAAAGRYGETRLAFAVESVLLDSLRTTLTRQRMRCDAVLPAFVAGWRHWRKQVLPGDALLGLAESEALTLVARDSQGWRSLRSLNGIAPDHYADTLRREALLVGYAHAPTLWLATPGTQDTMLASGVQRLATANGDAALALARLGYGQ